MTGFRDFVRVSQFGMGGRKATLDPAAGARLSIYTGVMGKAAHMLDRAIGLAFPTWAHRRQQARLRSVAMLSFYEGARVDRINAKPKSGSADAELLPDMQVLRDASRTMERDDAHMDSAVQVLEDNIIGTGLTPKPHVDIKRAGVSQSEADNWAQECERAWANWVEHSDSTEDGTFYDQQLLVLRGLIVDGEQLGHTTFTDDGMPQCELIDVDRLVSPSLTDTDKIRGGVERGDKGQPIAYHILERHPEDIMPARRDWKTVRIAKDEGNYSIVQHVYQRKRAGQTRGAPKFSSAIGYMRGFHDLMNSELTATRANAKTAMLITRPASVSDPEIQPIPGMGSDGRSGGYLQTLEDGMIEYLEPGEDVRSHIPNRPGTTFDPFVIRSLRAVCAAGGLSYEMVARDFGSMNYASTRGSFVELRRGFDKTRKIITRKFCTPYYRNVVLAKIANGELVPPQQFVTNPEAFLCVRWVHPAYGWVDPVKEVEAASMAVDANLSTPYDEAQRAGLDAEQILEDKAKFFARARELETKYGLEKGELTPSKNKQPQTGEPAARGPSGGAAKPQGGAGSSSPSDDDEE